MMRAIVLVCLVGAAAAATPLTAKKVAGQVKLSAEQAELMHFGCVDACKPSPIESKCATACEAKMYRCIDETGPNETPEDTKKCQDAVLKVYEETKGIEVKAENKTAGNATKGEKKKDAKKAKMFLQVGDVDDEEEETQDDSEDVETTADDETGDYSAQEDSGEEEAATQEEESATADDESAGDEEETHSDEEESSDAAEETSEEETPVEEESEEAAAPEEEATPEEPEEESFLQRDVDDTTEAAPAVEETQKVLYEEEGETDKNTEDLESKVGAEDESSEDESQGDEDEAAPEEAAAPEEEEEAAPVEESLIETGSSWKPDPSTTHIKLYEHPQGSTFVTACPVGEQTNTESCGAFFGDKAAADQCPQITCSKALGVTMKLVCAGGCCPSCWAPDHVIAVDRHTTVDDAQLVDAAAAAPGTCGGVKCFKLACASGFSEGHVNGACCNSCIPGR